MLFTSHTNRLRQRADFTELRRKQAKAAISAYLACVEQYDAELLVNGVTGVIFNDKAKRFEDHEMVCTSSVVSGFIQTKNTRYKLISKPPINKELNE